MKIPEKLSHYRIVRKLGAGGMGEVYLARDTRLDRDVALKILPPELSEDEERLGRFVREAKAASAIKHPNVAHIYEIGEAEGIHFIAMEYVEGETLAAMLGGGKPLDVARILEIGIQAADALDEAHSKGLVHRDVKSGNLMVTLRYQLKVLDFGLAKFPRPQKGSPDSEATTEARTREGVVLGTIQYMSPEQALGRAVDSRSDIFSLGVVLYQLTTGRLPFSGASPTETIEQITHAQPEAVARFNYDCPVELERILRKCLEKTPERRYQSARELQVDLENLKRDSDTSAVVTPQATPKASGRISRWAYVGLGLVLVALVGVGLYLFSGGVEPIDSLAVLPFENASGDPDMEYLSDGITETIISSLSRLPDVKVISRVSSFLYKGKVMDPQSVGRELDVDAVVLGRVAQRGEDLSISAELVDTRDASQLWGDQYMRNLADIFAIQEEMATEISRSLRLRLSGEEEASLTRHYTDDTEAYQAYLQGRYYWNKRTEEGFQKAIEYFEDAIEKDASYALAYSGLADCYNLLGYYSHVPPRDAYPKARAAAEKALEIDETLSEAHTSLAWVTFIYDWEWEEAEREFKRSIELNPSYATAHQWYSVYLLVMGRHEEAVTECRLALELDPQSPRINADLGSRLHHSGQHDEAEEWLRKALEMAPDQTYTHVQLGGMYMDQKKYQAAIDQFAEAGESRLGGLGYAYALSGNNKEALNILGRMQTLSKEQYVSPLELAAVYAGLDDTDSAFEWLERAYEERVSDLVFLKLVPMPDSLRSDPRFGDLMRRIGLEP